MSAFFLWLAIQGIQPATGQAATPDPAPAKSDDGNVYTACFLRELSRLEGRDIANWPGQFSRRKALRALRHCESAKSELAATIERELAADPQFADERLRALELQNRVMMAELPLLMLIRLRGQ
jgi:hypothetical protein